MRMNTNESPKQPFYSHCSISLYCSRDRYTYCIRTSITKPSSTVKKPTSGNPPPGNIHTTHFIVDQTFSKLEELTEKLKKERDFHRMHHKRVGQEKNKLLNDIKKIKEKYEGYKP